MRCAGCANRLRRLTEIINVKTEDVMDSDTRDPELEWLIARTGLSNRAVARILGVHYEAVRRVRLTGHLGDALRGSIRAYMEEHPGAEDGTESKPQPAVDGQPSEHDDDGDRRTGDTDRPVSKRRRRWAKGKAPRRVR